MADRQADFSEQNFSASDLASFDMSVQAGTETFATTQEGAEIAQDMAMITGLMREYSIVPGLKAVMLDGVILGAFKTQADMPTGLTIYIGIKASGFANYGDYSLPHQTLPNILYVYNSQSAQIEQNTLPGPYRTIAIHFADAEFRQMLQDDCIDEAERDMILNGLEHTRPSHFWWADPQVMESLQSLFTHAHTGVDHTLFVSQTILGVLRAILRHITRQEQDGSLMDLLEVLAA